MATNRVRQAVEEYERIVKKATLVYEDALRKAEMDLRTFISTEEPEPPKNDTVTVSRADWDLAQDQLAKVAEFIKQHPEINT